MCAHPLTTAGVCTYCVKLHPVKPARRVCPRGMSSAQVLAAVAQQPEVEEARRQYEQAYDNTWQLAHFVAQATGDGVSWADLAAVQEAISYETRARMYYMSHFIRAHRIELGNTPGPTPRPIFGFPLLPDDIEPRDSTLIRTILTGKRVVSVPYLPTPTYRV